MTSETIDELVRMQEADGSFPSEVTAPHGTMVDYNGFTSATVVRALRDVPGDADLDSLRSAAMRFVERCRSTKIPGAFGFWPEGLRPAWASRLPADIDDTAIMTVELMRHGRLARDEALRTVRSVLVPNRVIRRQGHVLPPWIMPGAFLTWLGARDRPNVVDCCVNANAVALMACTGVTLWPGFEEAVATIQAGVAWAGRNRVRQRAITPFYPSPHALYAAVQHAVECGAGALIPTCKQLRSWIGDQETATRAGCCSSAYGLVVWRCRALDQARMLRQQRVPARTFDSQTR